MNKVFLITICEQLPDGQVRRTISGEELCFRDFHTFMCFHHHFFFTAIFMFCTFLGVTETYLQLCQPGGSSQPCRDVHLSDQGSALSNRLQQDFRAQQEQSYAAVHPLNLLSTGRDLEQNQAHTKRHCKETLYSWSLSHLLPFTPSKTRELLKLGSRCVHSPRGYLSIHPGSQHAVTEELHV